MARYLFDGGEVLIDSAGNAKPAFAFTVWTDRVGGTDVTVDMMEPDGVTAATCQTDSDGEIPFLRGPEGTRGPLFLDRGTDKRAAYYSSEAMVEQASQLDSLRTAVAILQADLSALAATVGSGGLPAGVTLQTIPDGSSRLAFTSTERNKLATVATGATALTIGTTATTAKAGNYQPTPEQISAVRNLSGFGRVMGWTGPGQPTAADGIVDGDWVAIPTT